jgi:hypothetical protein
MIPATRVLHALARLTRIAVRAPAVENAVAAILVLITGSVTTDCTFHGDLDLDGCQVYIAMLILGRDRDRVQSFIEKDACFPLGVIAGSAGGVHPVDAHGHDGGDIDGRAGHGRIGLVQRRSICRVGYVGPRWSDIEGQSIGSTGKNKKGKQGSNDLCKVMHGSPPWFGSLSYFKWIQ